MSRRSRAFLRMGGRLGVSLLAAGGFLSVAAHAAEDAGIRIGHDPAPCHAYKCPVALQIPPSAAGITLGFRGTAPGRTAPGGDSSAGIGAEVTVSRAADIVGLPVHAVPALSLDGSATGSPLAISRLTSGFGVRRHPLLGGYRAHSGVDLAAPYGSPIAATSNGKVASAGWHGGYGLLVTLDHGKGTSSRYAHMSRLAVAPGQVVKKGQIIGYVGSTGRSTGPHLHYEMRVNGTAVNPLGKGAR